MYHCILNHKTLVELRKLIDRLSSKNENLIESQTGINVEIMLSKYNRRYEI
jgi:hypothetical protein